MPKAPEGGAPTGGTTPPADEFTPIKSQDELDKVIGERLTRERAKFADYDELKAKAAKVDEAEQAKLTAEEKTAARIADLETELSNQRRESTRMKIAAAHGITNANDIDLFLTGSDEETLTKQAKGLADRDKNRKQNNNTVPSEGTTTSTPSGRSNDEREFVRGLFGAAQQE